MRNKLVILHHELLYPAFLGAVLFEFAKRPIVDWFAKLDVLWFLSAFWFVLYFSAAFLSLADAQENDANISNISERKFGRVPFFANLLEIVVLLAVAVSNELIERPGFHDLNHLINYASWVLLPITAGISNHSSGRPVYLGLSVAAFLVGVIGLVLNCTGYSNKCSYFVLLMVMYFLLFVYYRVIFWDFLPWRTYEPPLSPWGVVRFLFTGRRA
jgi:hypothetical protein